MNETISCTHGSVQKSNNVRHEPTCITTLTEWLLRDDLLQHVNEDIRYSIIIAFIKFIQKDDNEVLVFPSSFTAIERGFVHVIARILGLHAKSFGSGQRRYLTVSRTPSSSTTQSSKLRLPLTWNSRRAIGQLLQTNPLTSKERLELHPRTEGNAMIDRGNREERQKGTTGRLMGAVPQIPPPASTAVQTGMSSPFSFTCTTEAPSILAYYNQIVCNLEANQVLIVFGPPGSGKTTYLPQILLDHCYNRGIRCRMICTQPRRLYAHINAERLAHIRGETVGQTVGYQIRLESKVSPKTLLTFCTHGVLLRTIYADPGLMTGTTHIIVDEIEEDELPNNSQAAYLNNPIDLSGLVSSSQTDGRPSTALWASSNASTKSAHPTKPSNGCGILLGLLPSLLAQYPHLKVILMVNLRKTTFDSWSLVTRDSSPSGTHSNGLRTDETLAVAARNKLGGENEEANGYHHLLIPEETVNQHQSPSVSLKSMSAFRTFEGQDKKDSSFHGVGPSRGLRNTTFTHVSEYNTDLCSNGVTELGPLVDSPSLFQSNECRAQSQQFRRERNNNNCAILLSAYFGAAPVVTIPFPQQKSKIYHLEDILQWVAYWNPSMEDASNELWQDELRCQTLVHWLASDLQLPSINKTSAADAQRDRESWQCGRRPNERDVLHDFDRSNLQWTENRVYSDGDVAKVVPLLNTNTVTDNKGSHQSTDATVNVLQQLNTGFTSNSRQHANNLLWTIWRGTVLSRDPEQNTDHVESYPPSQDVQALITNLHQCILAGWFPVDYQHSLSGLTALMVCSAAGLLDSVERLLGFGADVFLRAPMPYEILQTRARSLPCPDHNLAGPKHRRITVSGDISYLIVGVNAYDLARLFGHIQVAAVLGKHMVSHSLRHTPENWEAVLLRFGAWFDSPIHACPFNPCRMPNNRSNANKEDTSIMPNCGSKIGATASSLTEFYDNSLLLTYHVARNGLEPETVVDFELLIMLLTKLDAFVPEGSILIFLPSYEEIIYLRERLTSSDTSPWSQKESKHLVLILHSRMLVADLTRVYAKAPDGFRKIILSSSIAESCMTFNDVRYIIDCGLDCTKDYVKTLGSSTLRNHWISKSMAVQRNTRFGLGQTGLCFRLYSRIRFENLSDDHYVVPIRGHFIEEACIQARLLAPSNVTIQTVLGAVPRPPSSVACSEAIQSLVEMDALDSFQDLTELGYHICDIPIPPRYAKMVLVSVALKCLDPILTIACIFTYAEPFVIPKNATERREMLNARKKFSADTFSDHMMLLRAFQFWQKARSEGWEKSFCQKNFISTAAFETITVIRTQLLGQLRASGFVKARGSGDIRDLNTNSENWAVVKAAIVAGMHAHFIRVDREQGCLLRAGSANQDVVQLHPQSVLATNTDGTPVNFSVLPCDWLVYDELLTVSSHAEQNDDRIEDHEDDRLLALNTASVASNTELDPGHCSSTIPHPVVPMKDSASKTNMQTLRNKREELDFGLVRCATVVSPITIALMAGPMRIKPELLRVTENAIYDARTAQFEYQKRQAQLLTHPLMDQTALSSQSNPLISEWTQSTQLINNLGRSATRCSGNSGGILQRSEQAMLVDSCESYSDSESEEVWSALNIASPIHPNLVRSCNFPKTLDQVPTTSQKIIDMRNAKLPLSQKLPRVPSDLMNSNNNTPIVSLPNSVKYQSQTGSGLIGGSIGGTAELSSNSISSSDSDLVPLRFDDCELLHFHADSVAAQLILALRQKWQALLLRRLRNPGKQSSQQDEAILSVLVTVLTSEEQVLGLRQPSGVGARPRPMAVELCNQYDVSLTTTTTTTTTPDTNSPGSTCVTTGSVDRGVILAQAHSTGPKTHQGFSFEPGKQPPFVFPYTTTTTVHQLTGTQKAQTVLAKPPVISLSHMESNTSRVQPLDASAYERSNQFSALPMWPSSLKQPHPSHQLPHAVDHSTFNVHASITQSITSQIIPNSKPDNEQVHKNWTPEVTVPRNLLTEKNETLFPSTKPTTILDVPQQNSTFGPAQTSTSSYVERLIHSEPLIPLLSSSVQFDERPSSDRALDALDREGSECAPVVRTTITGLNSPSTTNLMNQLRAHSISIIP